jgi:plastocyanin
MRRVILAAVAAALLLPASAHAAVTRAVQAVSLQQDVSYWSPEQVHAQLGDTIEFRLTEPGNPNATKHDVWVIKPGESGNGTQIGTSETNGGIARLVVDQAGTYTFYDSVHGGLAPGGMHGDITVGQNYPGDPVDPGYPWMIPGSEYPGDAWANPTQAPTVFEEGDNTPPTITLVSSKAKDQTVTLVVYTNEAGTITGTVSHKKGKKVVQDSSKTITSTLGDNTLKVKIPTTPGDYTITVVATDSVELDSDTLTIPVTVAGDAVKAKAAKAKYTRAKRHR